MGSKFEGKPSEVRALSALINLFRAADSVNGRIGAAAEAAGLTNGQFGSLEALYHLGPLSHQQLAEKLLRTGGNVTMIVDNLEKRGLVERVKDERDRRSSRIELTSAGRALIKKVFPAHVQEVVNEFAALTAAEQDQLRSLCRKLGRQIS